MNFLSLLQLVASDSTHLIILLLLIVHFDREKTRHKATQERLERLERALRLLHAPKPPDDAKNGLFDELNL